MHRIEDQPAPRANTSRPIWELVIEDMKDRDRIGRERYGTPLQAHNGRNSLVDAYQEALDLAVYLRQAIEEQKAPNIRTLDHATVQLLVIAMRRYILYHGLLMGECQAWNELKRLVDVGQDGDCPSERPAR